MSEMREAFERIRVLAWDGVGASHKEADSLLAEIHGIAEEQAARQAPASGEVEAVAFRAESEDGVHFAGTKEGAIEEALAYGLEVIDVEPLFAHPPAKVPEAITECLKVQLQDGSWNYNPYMHGMANGLILAEAICAGTQPIYKSEPSEWLADTAYSTPATTAGAEWVKCPEIVRNTLFVLLEQYDCEKITDGVDNDGDAYASEWLDEQFTTIRRFLKATKMPSEQEGEW